MDKNDVENLRLVLEHNKFNPSLLDNNEKIAKQFAFNEGIDKAIRAIKDYSEGNSEYMAYLNGLKERSK